MAISNSYVKLPEGKIMLGNMGDLEDPFRLFFLNRTWRCVESLVTGKRSDSSVLAAFFPGWLMICSRLIIPQKNLQNIGDDFHPWTGKPVLNAMIDNRFWTLLKSWSDQMGLASHIPVYWQQSFRDRMGHLHDD